MDVYYALQVGEQYRCGGCSFLTTDVKALHFHVRQHNICGSYFFCNNTKTAFPRTIKKQATTQTELLVEITSDDIIRTGNSLRFIPEVEKTKSNPSKTPKKQSKKKASESNTTSGILIGFTDDSEPIDDEADIETADQTATSSHTEPNEGSNPVVEIPLSYKIMSNEELLDIFLNESPGESREKRAGLNYIVVQGGHTGSSTFDDGVRWNSFSQKSTKQVFTIDSDKKLTRIYKKGTRYCIMRLEKKRKKFEIMQPQPTTVFAFQKVFINLEGNNSYKRRITYISEAPDNLAAVIDKSIVEYYMDISYVRKETTSSDTQVSVTLPDCSKLKEMLYPGICKEIPDYVKENENSNEKEKEKSRQESSTGDSLSLDASPDVNEDIPESEINQGEMDISEIPKQTKSTAFQFMSNDEIVKVLMTEDDSNDANKHYTVFRTTKIGFNKLDEYGVWIASNTKNILFVQTEHREFKQVMKKNGQYCIFDKAAGNEYVELTPQPTKENLLNLQRCTFHLSNSNMIKKRETVVSYVPKNWLLGLENKHIVEYISEKMAMPVQSEKENGQRMMVVQHHKLLPCGPEFQEKLHSSKRAGIFPDLQLKSDTGNYFTNEEILEKLIVEDINTKSLEDSKKNYMVIQNEKADGRRKSYLKDGCVWNGKDGTSTNQTFIINEHNQLRGVMKRNDKWCVKKLENKKRFYTPIEPQPGLNELITIHKYFTSLKSCPLYKKRIASVTLAPERLAFIKSKILVEYYMENSQKASFKDLKELSSKENRKDSDKTETANEDINTSKKRKFDESVDGFKDPDEGQDEINNSTDCAENSQQEESTTTDLVESVSVELPVTDMFRTSQECWKIFTSDTPIQSLTHGTNTKDYVFVQCDESENGVNSSVYQDGLIWDTSGLANSRQSYLLESGKIGRIVVKKNGVLCYAKHEKQMQVYEPVDQQSQNIVTFYRTWVKLKGSNHIKKRVTNITEVPTKYALAKSRALIEYCIDGPSQAKTNTALPYIEMANLEDDHYLDTDEIESESEDETPLKSKSEYERPTYTPPNVNRTFRSQRLQQRNLKRLKIEPEVDNDTPDSEGSREKTDTSKKETSPKKNIKSMDGKFGFPMSSETMNSEEIFNLLLTKDGLNCLKDRPAGAKYAIVDVDWYGGERRRLLLDNFSWESSSGSTQNSFYEVNPDYTLTYLVQKNGKYHKKKKENHRVVYELLDPQPKEVVKVHRYWVKEKNMPDLAKRVTAITEAPERLADVKSRVLVEYSWC